ncbi:MAG: hypothetical protein JO072_07455 [Parafilimonas sp.]|nr:hypothetical protein [Parafilimonas sp.]
MNRFDAYIIYYLYEHKEVSLEKIGTLKAPASFAPGDGQTAAIEFIYDRKVATSPGLVDFIAEKAAKNKYLITSDLESHFSQVREFINIGKAYELPDVGFIKANKSGILEFLPYSEANKTIRITASTQQAKRPKSNNRSAVQLITVLIVIAILAGLGWEAYQYFSKSKNTDTAITNNSNNNTDTSTVNATNQDTINRVNADSVTAKPITNYSDSDTVNVRYIFETTASELRAQTRTAQLKGFGNNASYDSFINNSTKFYSLFIVKPTKLSDTLRIKDSLAKFFQKDVQVKIAANR